MHRGAARVALPPKKMFVSYIQPTFAQMNPAGNNVEYSVAQMQSVFLKMKELARDNTIADSNYGQALRSIFNSNVTL